MTKVTFKEFVTEGVVQKWDVSVHRMTDAYPTLIAKCKDYLDAIAEGRLLYRGFKDAPCGVDEFAIIDSTTGVRTSRDTNNLYQLMMETSTKMQHIPKRSKSLICSTLMDETVNNYGARHVMIPFDNVSELAVHGRSDMFAHAFISPLGVFDPDGSYVLAGFIDTVRSGDTNQNTGHGRFTDAAPIDAAFARHSPVALAVMWDDAVEDRGNLRYGGKSTADTIAHFEKVGLVYSDRPTNSHTAAAFKLFSGPAHNRFTRMCSTWMTPKSTDIKVVTPGTHIPEDREVWFAGKAMVVPFGHFATLLKEIQAAGHDIDHSILAAFESISMDKE